MECMVFGHNYMGVSNPVMGASELVWSHMTNPWVGGSLVLHVIHLN